jgi:hypothetical protein
MDERCARVRAMARWVWSSPAATVLHDPMDGRTWRGARQNVFDVASLWVTGVQVTNGAGCVTIDTASVVTSRSSQSAPRLKRARALAMEQPAGRSVVWVLTSTRGHRLLPSVRERHSAGLCPGVQLADRGSSGCDTVTVLISVWITAAVNQSDVSAALHVMEASRSRPKAEQAR